MENAIGIFSNMVNMAIPALIFIFLNDILFLSKDLPKAERDADPAMRRKHRKKLIKLIFVSPIGFFLLFIFAFIALEMIVNAFLLALGVVEFSSDVALMPSLSAQRGFYQDRRSRRDKRRATFYSGARRRDRRADTRRRYPQLLQDNRLFARTGRIRVHGGALYVRHRHTGNTANY